MPEKGKPPTSFFGRHSRMLSFVGALIVFATFIVKEGIKEKLKEDLDAISNAETVYAIREDNTRISGSRITVEWRQIKDNSLGPASDPSGQADRNEQKADLLDETDDALNSSFSNLFILEKAAREFDARDIPNLKDEHDMQDKLKDDYDGMLAGGMTDDHYLEPSPKDEHDLDDFVKFEDNSEFNLTRNDLIGTHIQELIEDKRERNERYYSIASILSYVFYVIGWTLGLCGRLFGVDNLVEE